MDASQTQAQAIKILQEAVTADTQQNYALAIAKYSEALALLAVLLRMESDPQSRHVLQSKIDEYTTRIQTLRASTPAAFPQTPGGRPLPATTSSGSARPLPTTNFRPLPMVTTSASNQSNSDAINGAITVLEGAKRLNELDNEYRVTATIGTTVVGAATKAYELDQQYKIHETVGTAVVASARKVAEIDEEYKVHETIGNAAVTAYEGAKNLDEEYRIVDRTSLALQNAYDGAVQLNEEYKITENIAQGLADGWEATKQFNEEYKVTDQIGDALASGWSWFAAAVAPQPAQPPQSNQ